jgi:hypothetical protein
MRVVRVRPHETVGNMEQCKYSALVKLNEPGGTGTGPPLEPGARVAVRARHHETGTSKLFSALIVVIEENSVRADHSIPLTLTVVGNDVPDYLDAGDSFVLWRGHDIGHGVILRRLSWFAEAP